MNNKYKSIVLGIFVYFFIYFLNNYLSSMFVSPLEQSNNWNIYVPISYWMSLLTWVLPSFIAGLINDGSGMLSGGIVGFLGAFATTLVGIQFGYVENGLSSYLYLIPNIINSSLHSAFIGVVAGGTGELIRKKRVK
jgi:hypothetical protein